MDGVQIAAGVTVLNVSALCVGKCVFTRATKFCVKKREAEQYARHGILKDRICVNKVVKE